MPSILLADSGSTKTDWCLLAKGKKPLRFTTGGINPHLQTKDDILLLLREELAWNPKKHQAERVVYYGAGAGSSAKQQEMTKVIRQFFGIKAVTVHGDMMAAARALCGDQKGMVSILGTGSNCCYYNGKKIAEQKPSLGYIAGDEGGGNYIGKRILQYYAYNTFDAELKLAFEQLFGNDIQQIIQKLYSTAFPNRYLASFVQLLAATRGHYMTENIIEDCLNDFFHHHILKYRNSWKLPLYFTGSVAYEFRDVIENLCSQYELELGKISKSPMDGLMAFHKREL